MEEAAPQEGVGKFLLVIGGDHTRSAVLRAHRLAGLRRRRNSIRSSSSRRSLGNSIIRLVDLIDQKHRPLRGDEGFPELTTFDVIGHIADAGIAELAVAQA